MNAIAYLRRSAKPRKGEQPVSLEQQAAAIAAYAKQADLSIVGAVAHDGVSGGKAARLDELWQTVKAHDAQAVIAYHFDRLGRDLEHLLAFRKRCDQASIAIHVIGQGQLPPIKTSRGFVETAIHGLMAEHYRLVISEKTREALAKLRAEGRPWFGKGAQPPYGWQRAPDGKTVAANPAEQASLEAIRGRLLAQDRTSLRKLGLTLAAEGIVARNGSPFTPSTLWKLRRRYGRGDRSGEGLTPLLS